MVWGLGFRDEGLGLSVEKEWRMKWQRERNLKWKSVFIGY